MFKYLFPLLLLGCSQFVEMVDDDFAQKIDIKSGSKEVSILHSNNINGETHPCGCRHFPLGGLPQVAGLFHKIQKTKTTLYLDAGDTFFPSSNAPKALEKSLKFTATKISEALNTLDLAFMVPGDQDFAAGVPFFNQLVKDKITILLSNLKNKTLIPHKKWVKLKMANKEIYITGALNPALLSLKLRASFTNVEPSLKEVLLEMKRSGFKNSPSQRLILLSHNGLEKDKELAKAFPELAWIIGSHTQSFLQEPVSIGNVQIVQGLSRNHHLGEIKISLSNKKEKDGYTLHQVEDKLEKELTPNPFHGFLSSYKVAISKIQEKEQEDQAKLFGDAPKVASASKCIECHSPQVKFWQQTPHSIAYGSLIQANESKNLKCVKCHSIHLGKKTGFFKANDIVSIKDKKLKDKYFKDLESIFKNKGSIRKMKKSEISKISNKWMDLDKKHKVEHNFANVHCFNCHDKSTEHPFDIDESVKPTFNKMKSKCLSCHTLDQDPEWYSNGKIKESLIKKNMKKIACPKSK